MHPNKFHSFVIGAILLVAPATVWAQNWFETLDQTQPRHAV